MPQPTQTFPPGSRTLTVTTPLKRDPWALVGFSGHEAISQPFAFHLDLIAENDTLIPFDTLLGQKVTVHLVKFDGKLHHFSGICKSIGQGMRDKRHTTYHMEVVPQIWLLSKRARCRIFQKTTVVAILKKVLEGLDVDYKIQGDPSPREFCVQYRETDLNFISRLMEEEGIYYYFTHSATGHTMVLANTPESHPDLPDQSKLLFEASSQGVHGDDRVGTWSKTQELRSGLYTLWDYNFGSGRSQHLEGQKHIADEVAAGKVTHKLSVANNAKMELYDYPGEYGKDVDAAGNVSELPADGKRIAAIRMEEETVPGLTIRGTSRCGQLVSGYRFTLGGHFNADGPYLVTGVQHWARNAENYDSTDEGASDGYHNAFTCIPFAVPFRPARVTPKPFVQGTQTAFVVGPTGEEIYTDAYGRVKVQFLWDRDGKSDADSSCWLRVGTFWAGAQNWGAIHIPRVGHEVIVDFEEGDPDRPIIVGSVYFHTPPYTLPDNRTQSGIKSRSSPGGGPADFNEIRFEDKKGSEEVYLHAQKDFNRVVENSDSLKVGSADTQTCPEGSQTISVWKDRTETVETGNEAVTIKKGNRTVTLDTGNDSHLIKKGNRDVQIDMGNDTLTIKMGNQTTKVSMGKIETEAMQSIELKVGENSIKIDPTGITLKGMMVSIEGQMMVQVKGPMVQVNADAMLMLKGGITMIG